MKDLEFAEHEAVLGAFERRFHGLFLAPILVLESCGDIEEGALFGAALLVAALIESVARIDTGSNAKGALIEEWLTLHIEAFRDQVAVGGGRAAKGSETVASIFESRFRNGLAHSGYVASLCRLSRSIDGPVLVSGSVVTVNPFRLARLVGGWFDGFACDLRAGQRDLSAFVYRVHQLFGDEVQRAKEEAA